jgi:hypothetical protein
LSANYFSLDNFHAAIRKPLCSGIIYFIGSRCTVLSISTISVYVCIRARKWTLPSSSSVMVHEKPSLLIVPRVRISKSPALLSWCCCCGGMIISIPNGPAHREPPNRALSGSP